jgi:hypothetical protein
MNRTKSAILSAATLFALGSASAQSPVTFIEPADTVVGYLDVPEDDELSIHLDVQNTSEDTLLLMATRMYIDTVSPYNYPWVFNEAGAYDRFCWGPLCYNFGTDQSSTNASLLVTMEPGEVNTTLVTDYYHAGIVGMSTLRYCLHEVGQDPVAGSCHDITFRIEQALDLQEVVLEPTLSRLSELTWRFDLAGASSGTFRVVDLQGRTVFEQAVNAPSGQIQLPADRFPAAPYIIAIETPSERRTESVFLRGH